MMHTKGIVRRSTLAAAASIMLSTMGAIGCSDAATPAAPSDHADGFGDLPSRDRRGAVSQQDPVDGGTDSGTCTTCGCSLEEYAEDEDLTYCSPSSNAPVRDEPLSFEDLVILAGNANVFKSTVACAATDMSTKPAGGIRYPSEVSDALPGPPYTVNQIAAANTCGTVSDVTGTCMGPWYKTANDTHIYANWAAGCVDKVVAIVVAKEVDQKGAACTGKTIVDCKVQVQGHPTLAAWFHAAADLAAVPQKKAQKILPGDKAMSADKDTAIGAGEVILAKDNKTPCWNASSGRYGAGVAAHKKQITDAFAQLPKGTATAAGIAPCG